MKQGEQQKNGEKGNAPKGGRKGRGHNIINCFWHQGSLPLAPCQPCEGLVSAMWCSEFCPTWLRMPHILEPPLLPWRALFLRLTLPGDCYCPLTSPDLSLISPSGYSPQHCPRYKPSLLVVLISLVCRWLSHVLLVIT